MARTGEKVVVAMSGGVDSSVAACLLHEQGYDVTGLFMRVGAEPPPEETCAAPTPASAPTRRAHQGCCSALDAADARFVAGRLGVPFYALNFRKDFDRIIDYFAGEYADGRTPNPCVVCNSDLKFGRIVDYADTIGARWIATGHYARIDRSAGAVRLLRGVDHAKDQSYVLFGVARDVFDRVLFPIGHLPKSEVRQLAASFDLPNQHKPDSVEICFVPDRNYARVVRERRPDAFEPGDVLDSEGHVLGRHDGVANFTIGQRRGLGIAAGRPIYVTSLNVLNHTVVMGDVDELLQPSLTADRVNFLVDPPGESFRAAVKIRYLHTAAAATVHVLAGDRIRVEFDEPQRAVTPGQAAVLYDGDIVLGGGWIVGP
jgi:tRNA-specific 2-thiouridylase